MKRKHVSISDTATVVGAPNFPTIFFAVQNTIIEPIPLILEAAPEVRVKNRLNPWRLTNSVQFTMKQDSNRKEFLNARSPRRRTPERSFCAIPNRYRQRFVLRRTHPHRSCGLFPLQF